MHVLEIQPSDTCVRPVQNPMAGAQRALVSSRFGRMIAISFLSRMLKTASGESEVRLQQTRLAIALCECSLVTVEFLGRKRWHDDRVADVPQTCEEGGSLQVVNPPFLILEKLGSGPENIAFAREGLDVAPPIWRHETDDNLCQPTLSARIPDAWHSSEERFADEYRGKADRLARARETPQSSAPRPTTRRAHTLLRSSRSHPAILAAAVWCGA